MTISAIEIEVPNADNVSVTDDSLSVDLSDGRTISVPPWHGSHGCSMLQLMNALTGDSLVKGKASTGKTLMRISMLKDYWREGIRARAKHPSRNGLKPE